MFVGCTVLAPLHDARGYRAPGLEAADVTVESGYHRGVAIGIPRPMIQTSIGGRAKISMTPWRHMKHTASMPVDGGVHEADLLRYYMSEFKLVYGETRLDEEVRHQTDSTGPGGFYGGDLATMPD